MNRKLRILAPQIGINLSLGGGRYDYEQLGGLVRLGHRVHVIIPSRNKMACTMPDGVSVQWISGRSGFSWNLVFFWPLLRACFSRKPDIIRIHSPWFLGLAGLCVGRLFGIPVIGSLLHIEDMLPGSKWVKRHLLHRFDGLLCISKATAVDALSLVASQIPVDWAYCGIEPRFHPDSINKLHLAGTRFAHLQEPLFLFVGSLIPRKNLGWMISSVFSEYVQEGNKGTLIIAGTGSEEHLLRSLSSGNGLKNRIFFAGNINDIEQLSLYRNVTALVFPSLQEGFGLAPAEAMACGTPAIVSDRGSLPEIVRHRETGFVLSIDCGPGPWVDAMKHLSENTRLRNRMGMAAMHDVRNRFSWDENAMRATRFFYRIIERRHSQYIT